MTGIYKIECIKNNKIYVGKSTYIRTPELNKKMSEILMGHKLSTETKLKISNTLRRRYYGTTIVA